MKINKILHASRFQLLDMDADTVHFHIFFRVDQNVLDAADDPGLDQIGPVRRDLDAHIGSLDLQTLVIDDILGMQLRIKAESGIKIHTELGDVRLRYALLSL